MIAPPPPTPLALPDPFGDTLRTAFAQPALQALPQDFLAMLVALDRAKRAG